jgi:hypothetical protein
MISQSDLRLMLDYNPENGVFTWLVNKGRAKAGDVAGSIGGEGYIIIAKTLAHRLAWIWMTGAVPRIVDHEDRIRTNNRWSNLRPASKAQNAVNSKLNIRNVSGLRGVSWHKGGRKWQAHCGPKYLGLFASAGDAHAAYLEAAATSYGMIGETA